MPNHTDNLLTIVGEKRIMHLLLPYLTSTNGESTTNTGLIVPDYDENDFNMFLDFNKIVPMPEEILETEKLADMDSIQMMGRNDEAGKRMKKRLAQLEKICQKKYGVKGWYDWSNQYWGTKWNSYENRLGVNEEENELLFFQTAWSPPEPVLSELAQKLDKVVRVTYKDEGYGFFGTYHFFPDGDVDDECYTDHSMVPESICRELGINTYAEDEKERREFKQETQRMLKRMKKKRKVVQ